MKTLIVLGSTNPDGRTAKAAGALARGIANAGGTSESVFLTKMNIERCRQCDSGGWGTCRSDGSCVIEDDFASLVDKIKSCDAVAFATPVYFSDLSESMKSFLDRLRRICTNETGRDGIGKRYYGGRRGSSETG